MARRLLFDSAQIELGLLPLEAPATGGGTRTVVGSGGFALSGGAAPERRTTRQVSGGIAFSSSAVQARRRSPGVSGGALFGGEADYSSVAGSKSYSFVASGGLVLAGEGFSARGTQASPSGGMVLGGAAIWFARTARAANSGYVFGGTAALVRIGGNVATRIYGIDLGAPEETVTEGVGLATTKGMELTIDLDKFTSKQAVIVALESLRNYIAEDSWPPT